MREGERLPPLPVVANLLKGARRIVVRYARGDGEIVTDVVDLDSLYELIGDLDLQLTR